MHTTAFNFVLYDAFCAASDWARMSGTPGAYKLKQACYEMWHALSKKEGN